MRYLHTMVRVTDLEASLEFYVNVLGMTEIKRVDYASGRFTLIFLAASGDSKKEKNIDSPLIELTYNWDKEELSSGRNFGHLAFRVDDIYETCQKMIASGLEINRPPRDGRMAFIKSPDNISIELLQAGDALPEKEPWMSMPNKGSW
tara:strand:+ start:56 stop:496 length:441 start_codon:yes stop_codon:yes gene_type:complete